MSDEHPGGTSCDQFNRDVEATMAAYQKQVARLIAERDALLEALMASDCDSIEHSEDIAKWPASECLRCPGLEAVEY